MLDNSFKLERAKLVRELADKADPFTKSRLLALADRYERRARSSVPLPAVSIRDGSASE